jgi:hypothetical protein
MKPIGYLRNAEYNRALWLHYNIDHDAWSCLMLANEIGIDIFKLDESAIHLSASQQAMLEAHVDEAFVIKLRRHLQAARPSFWQQQLGEYYDGIANEATRP